MFRHLIYSTEEYIVAWHSGFKEKKNHFVILAYMYSLKIYKAYQKTTMVSKQDLIYHKLMCKYVGWMPRLKSKKYTKIRGLS